MSSRVIRSVAVAVTVFTAKTDDERSHRNVPRGRDEDDQDDDGDGTAPAALLSYRAPPIADAVIHGRDLRSRATPGDRSVEESHGKPQPMSLTSGSNSTPQLLSTSSRIRLIRASTSAVVASPRFTKKLACTLDISAPPLPHSFEAGGFDETAGPGLRRVLEGAAEGAHPLRLHRAALAQDRAMALQHRLGLAGSEPEAGGADDAARQAGCSSGSRNRARSRAPTVRPRPSPAARRPARRPATVRRPRRSWPPLPRPCRGCRTRSPSPARPASAAAAASRGSEPAAPTVTITGSVPDTGHDGSPSAYSKPSPSLIDDAGETAVGDQEVRPGPQAHPGHVAASRAPGAHSPRPGCRPPWQAGPPCRRCRSW